MWSLLRPKTDASTMMGLLRVTLAFLICAPTSVSSILESWATDFLQKGLFISLIIYFHELDILVFANILHSLTIYQVIYELEEVFFKGILSSLLFLSIKYNIWGKQAS
ncbi:hypothetical protein RclHR1_21790004 [Rhizophagus clarus]|uniref:Uncharacterized protein n=1 Tax=Rhizophagus clarus TaxID=94130 RepID=A0A2Z6RMM7_9GLOM|nr:hypothetical protein RclHR1_21790004 [Rhizophagus clarus]GET01411.1 hypothetical protein RCL_e8605_RclHR1_21790004 [Rhizophagus clarus]